VDFGGGLERIAAAANNDPDVFKTSHFEHLFDRFQDDDLNPRHITYGNANPEQRRALRIVADHLRAACFLIADGVLPSNTDKGYFVRRLLRRAIRYADSLGIVNISSAVSFIECEYLDGYVNYFGKGKPIYDPTTIIAEEEDRFRLTLSRGMKEFERLAIGTISSMDAFTLFSSYGFPLELTEELATERGITVDTEGFKTEMAKHQDTSRAGSEQKFKGGLADGSEATTRLHTTHHLLLKALQMVLGGHVHQRGSNITSERLRIDFAHQDKMTEEEKREVERIVNEQIDASLPVTRSLIPREEAEKLHAEHEFGTKYPDTVSVYSVGPIDATEENPQFDKAFSIEFCGGPHVTNTSEIKESGHFHIQKEEASSAGIRRIKGVLS
jgi:alanyl-tRNA synthetase